VAVSRLLSVEGEGGPYLHKPYVDEGYVFEEHYAPRRNLKSDAEMKEDIEDELSPFVDSDQVKVFVEDGIAVLTGKVESLSDIMRREAMPSREVPSGSLINLRWGPNNHSFQQRESHFMIRRCGER